MDTRKLLQKAAEQASLPKMYLDKIDQLQFSKVYLYEKKKKMLLLMNGVSTIPHEMLLKLATGMEELLKLDTVCMWPSIERENWCEATRDRFLEVLREEMGQKAFLLKGCISTIEIKDDMLDLGLNVVLAVDYFKKEKHKRSIYEMIHIMMPWLKDVVFHLDEDKDFSKSLEVLEKDRLLTIHESNQNMDSKKESSSNGAVLLGRQIKEAPQPIFSIKEEERSATLQGKVINLEIRELRSGRTLVTFDLVDKKSGITVKYFTQENESFNVNMSNNQFVKVRGSVQTDRYSQELTMMLKDINRAEHKTRTDDSEQKRVELHLHTTMSALDGMTDLKMALKRAHDWKHPYMAVTDHGGVQAFPAAHTIVKKEGLDVNVVYGMEAYYIDDREGKDPKARPYHMIILVKNPKGFPNLYKLVTSSNLNHFYRKPRVVRSELDASREGLIIGSACEAGELFQALYRGEDTETIENIARYYDYLEIQPIGNNEFMLRENMVSSRQELENLNRQIVELGEKLDIPVVATGDVHFLDPEDEIYRKIIQTGQGYKDTTQPPLYYRTTEEMLQEFSYLDEEKAREIVIDNPIKICQSIEKDMNPVQTKLHPPKIEGAEQEIRTTCAARAIELYGEPLPQIVEERMERELGSIIENGFSVLYLIAEKLVKKSNQDGYLVGSRGSVGSSFVATLLGITEVNPLAPHYSCPSCHNNIFITDGSVGCGADLPDRVCEKCGTKMIKDGHEIPFETFLGFNGDKIPDIDLNFSGDYQTTIHKYTEVLFGKDNVFKAGTIATVAEKTAFGFVKKFLEENGVTNARNAQLAALASGCTGVKRTTGQHPGGIIVLPKGEDVNCFTPLQRPAEDTNSDIRTSHFDYHSIDASLVKLDLLGHDDPTAIKMLEDLTGTNAKSIPLDDPATLSLFSSADALDLDCNILPLDVGSLGIPEFGTKFVRQMLQDTRPKAFSELVRISGFSHGTDVWLNNAQDLIVNKTAKLSEAISTRDDIMSYLLHKKLEPIVAFRIMEDVRKGKGLKPEYEQDMKEHEVPAWYIDSCKKIKYMFPKAHAVAYVTMAFRIAWYKINYPEAFYATYFTVRADEFDLDIIRQGPRNIKKEMKKLHALPRLSAREKNVETILEIALEMYARGIKLLPMDLYRSSASDFIVEEKALLPPFNTIPGLGTKAANSIVEVRDSNKIMSIEDLRLRTRISTTVVDKMREMGMLEGLPESEQMSLFG